MEALIQALIQALMEALMEAASPGASEWNSAFFDDRLAYAHEASLESRREVIQ
jgi:hypothetical protein